MDNTQNRAITVTTILLAILTGIYVVLTGYMVLEMKKQTKQTRKSYQESLKPYLQFELDSLQFHNSPFDGHPSRSMTGNIRIRNEGNTPAKVILVGLDILPFSEFEVNVRDSLLYADSTFNKFIDMEWRFSKYIPAHHSIWYVSVWEDVPSKSKPDGTFFVHVLILYQDTFGVYHDIYCVFKITVDWKNQEAGKYPPTYSFYEYDRNEIKKIFTKGKLVREGQF
ncbi:hypothetical protein KAW50_08395 [candidate division WOR-3 bacterium]|nr:hypothetical protein [candidate division WOR-3 bacterium]